MKAKHFNKDVMLSKTQPILFNAALQTIRRYFNTTEHSKYMAPKFQWNKYAGIYSMTLKEAL